MGYLLSFYVNSFLLSWLREGAKLLTSPFPASALFLTDSYPKISSVYPLSLYQDGQDIDGEKNQAVELVFFKFCDHR